MDLNGMILRVEIGFATSPWVFKINMAHEISRMLGKRRGASHQTSRPCSKNPLAGG